MHSNNLPSTSFSHVLLGSMDEDTPSLDMTEPHMEKMYMEDEGDATPCLHDEQVGHMDAATSTTTPKSHEWDYNGTHMGVDDAMIPLVDMMTCDCLHDVDFCFDVTYDSFTFPCDTLFKTNVDHVDFPTCDDLDTCMPCYESFQFSPIVACNMSNNFSFICVA